MTRPVDLDEAGRKANWLAHLAAEVSAVSLSASKSAGLASEARSVALTTIPAMAAELRAARAENQLLRAAVEQANNHLNRLPWTGAGVDLAAATDHEIRRVVEGAATVLDPEDLGLKGGDGS